MLNGNEILIKDFVVKNEQITFKKIIGSKEKKRNVDKFRVFSIVKNDGTEQIIYEPDTSYDLSVDQMRIYIEGEQAAIKYYHKPGNVVAGVIAGVAGSYFTFYGLPVPVLYGAIAGRISPKVKVPADAIYPNQKTEEFREGYKRKGKDIKTRQTLISGLIGFALSVTFFSLYEGNVKF
jgi:hypothetical protein